MQILSAASGLNPGQDLWILSESSQSRWNTRLDWYLNFQLDRASRHQPKKRPEPIRQILQEVEWQLPEIEVAEASPLLISCEGHLPARWLAMIPMSSDVKNWVTRLHQLWKGLGQPTFKVFLPTGVEATTFTQHWKKLSSFEDFSLVLDQDPRLPLP